MRGHSELRDMIASYRGLGLAERSAVDRHVQACAECAGRLAFYERMDRDLAGMADPQPRRSAAAMRSAALRSTAPGGLAFLDSRWAWAALASLTLLTMLVAGTVFFRSGSYLERGVAETPSITPTPTFVLAHGTPHRSEDGFAAEAPVRAGTQVVVAAQPTVSALAVRAAATLQGVTPAAFGRAGP